MAKKAVRKLAKRSESRAAKMPAKKTRVLAKGAAAQREKQAQGLAKSPLESEPVAHMLEALLHTMRSIAQHEDALCTLLHDVRRRRSLGVGLRRELRQVLLDLPAEDYLHDLYAIQLVFA